MTIQQWRPAYPGDAAWDDRLVVHGGAAPTWRAVGLPWSSEHVDRRFQPDYSPQEMAAMGVFGDAYWGGPCGVERLGMLTDFDLHNKRVMIRATRFGVIHDNIRASRCKTINYFGRPASLTKDWWLDRGLIYNLDPLGWYEWYHWYSRGRRVQGYDEWQVGRWLNFKERHTAMYLQSPAPGHAQALLHWGIRAPIFEAMQ